MNAQMRAFLGRWIESPTGNAVFASIAATVVIAIYAALLLLIASPFILCALAIVALFKYVLS